MKQWQQQWEWGRAEEGKTERYSRVHQYTIPANQWLLHDSANFFRRPAMERCKWRTEQKGVWILAKWNWIRTFYARKTQTWWRVGGISQTDKFNWINRSPSADQHETNWRIAYNICCAYRCNWLVPFSMRLGISIHSSWLSGRRSVTEWHFSHQTEIHSTVVHVSIVVIVKFNQWLLDTQTNNESESRVSNAGQFMPLSNLLLAETTLAHTYYYYFLSKTSTFDYIRPWWTWIWKSTGMHCDDI